MLFRSEHARRVSTTALALADKVSRSWPDIDETHTQYLHWAAQMHEIGQDVSHSQYHKHGAYIVENADLMGFSRSEQKLLAILVRAHRRKINHVLFDGIAGPGVRSLARVAILLRIAVVLNRSRSVKPLPPVELGCGDNYLVLKFPLDWLGQHPLTALDLEHEAAFLRGMDFNLEIA